MNSNLPTLFTPEERALIMTITPEIADNWLSFNGRNRKLRDAAVMKHVNRIKSGIFKFNGDSIRWSTWGRLLDGQHRLSAVVETGIPIKTVVVWGLDEDSQITMDRNDKRSLMDHLQIMGEESTKVLATALSLSVQYFELGHRFNIGVRGGVEFEASHKYLMNNPNIRASVALATDTPRVRKVINPAHLAFIHWVLSNVDPVDADDFLDRLITGRHDHEHDAVWRFRERMIDLREQKVDRAFDVIPLAFKAWNLYRSGEPVKFLRVRRGGSAPESFPEPK